MNSDNLSACVTVLQGRFLMNRNEFPEPVEQLYAHCLLPMDDEAGVKTVTYCCEHLDDMPTPADLWKQYADTVSPTPDADLAWTEVEEKVHRYGAYCLPSPNPKYPNFRGEGGEPDWSHPLIADAIHALGSYTDLRTGAYEYNTGGTVGQFKTTYNRLRETWRKDVQSAVKAGEKPARLFTLREAYVPVASHAGGENGQVHIEASANLGRFEISPVVKNRVAGMLTGSSVLEIPSDK